MFSLHIDQSQKFQDFFTPSCRKNIKFLVFHHVQADDANHAISQFYKHQVSSHFLIDEGGNIFSLVEERNIAYHAGVSYWAGVDSLNTSSIGIEFINSDPFNKRFTDYQIDAGIALSRHLVEKYAIKQSNIVGHSDIAYNKETGFLDRKQDPSHLFDWKKFAENGIGVFPDFIRQESYLFSHGDCNQDIAQIKQLLASFGYKIKNFDANFDEEMMYLCRVFNRRFFGLELNDGWNLSLEDLMHHFSF